MPRPARRIAQSFSMGPMPGPVVIVSTRPDKTTLPVVLPDKERKSMLVRTVCLINKMAHSFIPHGVLRAVADFPGVLRFNELTFGRVQVGVTTPEGQTIKMNPLFHGHLSSTEKLLNYEPEVRKTMVKLVKPGMTAYDIGANIGVFTFLMSSLVGNSGKVYAFEPEINNYRHLSDSVKANKAGNIVALQIAAGESSKESSFDRRGGSFSGRIIDSDTKYKVTRNIASVTTKSVDDIVADGIAKPPDFIKIDVEGYEGKVLLGMKNVLMNFSPIILCEVHAHLSDPAVVVHEALSSAGYSIYELEGFLNGSLFRLETLENVPRIIAVKGENLN